MNISYRNALFGDSDFVYLTKKEALGQYIAFTWGWDEDFQLEFHKKDYQPEKTEIILLDSIPIGWWLTTRGESHWTLNEFYIQAAYQRRGIGGYVLTQFLSEADTAGLPVKLSVLKANPAKAFYERHGFIEESQDEHYFKMKRKAQRSVAGHAALA